MRRRLLTFLLAVLLAAIGTAGVLGYVRGADNRALRGIQAMTVLVAAKAIPAGTPASQAYRDGMLQARRFPVSAVPAGALARIPAQLAGLVTSAPLQPGELLLQKMLVHPSGRHGSSVPPGKYEVAMQFCLAEAVGGYIHIGSWVAVLNTSSSSGPVSGQSGCSLEQQQQLNTKTQVMVPGLQIAAVGPGSAGQGGSQPGTSRLTQPGASQAGSAILVTFFVDQAQAEELTLLNETGVPSLALLPGPPQGSLTSSADPPATKH